MISKGELFVLNTALDGKSIFALKSFNEYKLGINAFTKMDDDRKGLIEKGLIEDKRTITIEGAKFLRKLEVYKNAKKYIRIQDLWIGIQDEKNGVVILEKSYGNYEVELLKINRLISILSNKYPYILDGAGDGEEIFVSKKEIFKKYYIQSQGGFLLEGAEKNKIKYSYLIYTSEGKTYIYDNLKNLLQRSSFSKIEKLINEIIKIGD